MTRREETEERLSRHIEGCKNQIRPCTQTRDYGLILCPQGRRIYRETIIQGQIEQGLEPTKPGRRTY